MTPTPLTEALLTVLADHYAVYLKTQNYHWNVEGMHFRAHHALFEEQYVELAQAVDEIAELIRALGSKVPASFEFFAQKTTVKAGDEKASAEQMLQDLLKDQAVLEGSLSKALQEAQKLSHEVVCDFVIGRLKQAHKTAWMLRSSLAS